MKTSLSTRVSHLSASCLPRVHLETRGRLTVNRRVSVCVCMCVGDLCCGASLKDRSNRRIHMDVAERTRIACRHMALHLSHDGYSTTERTNGKGLASLSKAGAKATQRMNTENAQQVCLSNLRYTGPSSGPSGGSRLHPERCFDGDG